MKTKKGKQPASSAAPTGYAVAEVYQDHFKTGTHVDLILPFKYRDDDGVLRIMRFGVMYLAGPDHYKRGKALAKQLGGKRVPLHAA